jgi:outer membrane protein
MFLLILAMAAYGSNEPNSMAVAIDANVSVDSNVLRVTVTDATLLSLENNKSLLVQRFTPQIQQTFEQEQLSAFDPNLSASIARSRRRAETIPRPGLPSSPELSKDVLGNVGISQFFPTGTAFSLDGSTDVLSGSFLDQPFATTRIGGTVTQSLLRGFGTTVNLASVNQARIDTKATEYELRGFTESLVAQTEETYWDYMLAQYRIKIFTQSFELAKKQLDETKERIKVGALARSEQVAAEAEVALQQEFLINARSTLAKTKLNLLRLVNPPGRNLWDREIILTTRPLRPVEPNDTVEPHVALALQMRPDLNQAKLQWQRDDLEVVKTKNGLLPRLDLFLTLGKTGYADSFGHSVDNIFHNNDYDILGGVTFGLSPLNRGEKARNLRAVVTRNQAREAINNLVQLVEVDVRTAYLEIIRTQEQVAATGATRKLQEEKFNVEAEKFRVGKSTSLLVAQTQRDLLVSQITETDAIASYIKSFVELYRLEGSLLERRGIVSPGREAVKLKEFDH